MSEEEKAKIINKTMSSESWQSEVRSFPAEWQVRAESAMAKALGHGLYEGCKNDPHYPVFDTMDRLFRDGHYIWHAVPNGMFYLSNAGGGTVMSGRSFRELCVNIVLAGL